MSITLPNFYGSRPSASAPVAPGVAPETRNVRALNTAPVANGAPAGGPAWSWVTLVLVLVGVRMLHEYAGGDVL